MKFYFFNFNYIYLTIINQIIQFILLVNFEPILKLNILINYSFVF